MTTTDVDFDGVQYDTMHAPAPGEPAVDRARVTASVGNAMRAAWSHARRHGRPCYVHSYGADGYGIGEWEPVRAGYRFDADGSMFAVAPGKPDVPMGRYDLHRGELRPVTALGAYVAG